MTREKINTLIALKNKSVLRKNKFCKNTEFQRLYMDGVKAYDIEDWTKCEYNFQKSLFELLKEIDKCRLLCEDFLDWSSLKSANPETSIVFTSIKFLFKF